MASIKDKVVDENKTVTQTFSMKGRVRNRLVEVAESNGLSVSAYISFVMTNHLNEVETVAHK